MKLWVVFLEKRQLDVYVAFNNLWDNWKDVFWYIIVYIINATFII